MLEGCIVLKGIPISNSCPEFLCTGCMPYEEWSSPYWQFDYDAPVQAVLFSPG